MKKITTEKFRGYTGAKQNPDGKWVCGGFYCHFKKQQGNNLFLPPDLPRIVASLPD